MTHYAGVDPSVLISDSHVRQLELPTVLDRAIVSGQIPIPMLKLQQTARSNMQGPHRDSALGLLKSMGSGGLNTLMQPNVSNTSCFSFHQKNTLVTQ